MSKALLTAVEIIGSRVELANRIGTTVQVVKAWINSNIRVPMQYGLEIQRVTNGQVTWQEVCPYLKHFSFNQGGLSIVDPTSNALPQLVTQVSLSRIVLDPSASLNVDEIQALSINIKQQGLQRAICLDQENQLIFGEKRFHAFKILGKKSITCWRLSLSGIVKGEYAITELCKNFLWSERLAIALVIEKCLGNRQGQRSDLELRQNFVEVKLANLVKGRTGTLLANHLGFGNRETYVQSKKIYLNGGLGLIQAVDRGDVSILGALVLLHLSHEQQNQIVALSKTAIKRLLRLLKKGKPFEELDFSKRGLA